MTVRATATGASQKKEPVEHRKRGASSLRPREQVQTLAVSLPEEPQTKAPESAREKYQNLFKSEPKDPLTGFHLNQDDLEDIDTNSAFCAALLPRIKEAERQKGGSVVTKKFKAQIKKCAEEGWGIIPPHLLLRADQALPHVNFDDNAHNSYKLHNGATLEIIETEPHSELIYSHKGEQHKVDIDLSRISEKIHPNTYVQKILYDLAVIDKATQDSTFRDKTDGEHDNLVSDIIKNNTIRVGHLNGAFMPPHPSTRSVKPMIIYDPFAELVLYGDLLGRKEEGVELDSKDNNLIHLAPEELLFHEAIHAQCFQGNMECTPPYKEEGLSGMLRYMYDQYFFPDAEEAFVIVDQADPFGDVLGREKHRKTHRDGTGYIRAIDPKTLERDEEYTPFQRMHYGPADEEHKEPPEHHSFLMSPEQYASEKVQSPFIAPQKTLPTEMAENAAMIGGGMTALSTAALFMLNKMRGTKRQGRLERRDD